jgi:simple sugar transport system permease protein
MKREGKAMTEHKEKHIRLWNDSTKTVASSLISILIGVVFGGLLLFFISMTMNNIPLSSAWEGFRIVISGIFNAGRDQANNGAITFGYNAKLMGDMLFRATPLIMTGLSVALAYKTGLFNIGAPGQYLMGTAVSIVVALSINTAVVPSWIAWIAAFAAAIAAGAIWGCIPGFFKAFLNVNEVITSIMTNWIAANLVTIVFDRSKFINMVDYGKTGYTIKTNMNGVASATFGFDKLFSGSNANIGILIAVVFAIVIYIIISKTTFGYELKACGSNKNAAKYAGMNEKRNIVLSMAIAGALSAAGAAMYYLQGDIEFYWHTSMSLPATGFNGIPVALLANCNPIGTIFAGMFMAYLNISGNQLSTYTAYNEYIANIIIAVIVYLSAFTLFFKGILNGAGKNAAIKNDEKMSTDSKPVDEANNAEEGGK